MSSNSRDKDRDRDRVRSRDLHSSDESDEDRRRHDKSRNYHASEEVTTRVKARPQRIDSKAAVFVPKQSNRPPRSLAPAYSEEPNLDRRRERSDQNRNGNSQEWVKAGQQREEQPAPAQPTQPQAWTKGGGWVSNQDSYLNDKRSSRDEDRRPPRPHDSSPALRDSRDRDRDSRLRTSRDSNQGDRITRDDRMRLSRDPPEQPRDRVRGDSSRDVSASSRRSAEPEARRTGDDPSASSSRYEDDEDDVSSSSLHEHASETPKGSRRDRRGSEDDRSAQIDIVRPQADSAPEGVFHKVWHPAAQASDDEGVAADPTVPPVGQNKPSFVLVAHPRGVRCQHIQCTVLRDRHSMQGKLYPQYELVLEEPRRTLIVARKMSLNRTSNYHLFDMTRGQAGSKLSKKAGNYLGKLRAKNTHRTDYSLLNHKADREEIAGVCFDKITILGQLKDGNQPRKMKIILPAPCAVSGTIEGVNAAAFGLDSLTDLLAEVGDQMRALPEGLMIVETKEPVLENGNYRLNFYGRVNLPSVKNFQIVHASNIDNVLCQFGKVDEDVFHLDFKAPFNAVQAFALALCQFNL